MLSRQETIDFRGLTEREIRAIFRRGGVSTSPGQSFRDGEPINDDGMEDALLYEETEEEDLQQVLYDFKASHCCENSDVDDGPE